MGLVVKYGGRDVPVHKEGDLWYFTNSRGERVGIFEGEVTVARVSAPVGDAVYVRVLRKGED